MLTAMLLIAADGMQCLESTVSFQRAFQSISSIDILAGRRLLTFVFFSFGSGVSIESSCSNAGVSAMTIDTEASQRSKIGREVRDSQMEIDRRRRCR